jgi:hypothetical protein
MFVRSVYRLRFDIAYIDGYKEGCVRRTRLSCSLRDIQYQSVKHLNMEGCVVSNSREL